MLQQCLQQRDHILVLPDGRVSIAHTNENCYGYLIQVLSIFCHFRQFSTEMLPRLQQSDHILVLPDERVSSAHQRLTELSCVRMPPSFRNHLHLQQHDKLPRKTFKTIGQAETARQKVGHDRCHRLVFFRKALYTGEKNQAVTTIVPFQHVPSQLSAVPVWRRRPSAATRARAKCP